MVLGYGYVIESRGRVMGIEGSQLPETLIGIVGENRDYSIYLLDGGELIFFPA